ncbi:MAG: hypothetical protein ABW046_07145 [Actinoplanes sp.]
MTDQMTTARAEVVPGGRLESLLAAYAELKPQADEAANRLKSITGALKAELMAAAPEALRVEVDHPALALPLRLSWVESWTLDTKQLKADEPATYVKYARKGGKWDLRGLKA